MKTPKLTVEDIDSAENSGWGYINHNVRNPDEWTSLEDFTPAKHVHKMDELVVRVFNRLNLTKAELFEFVESAAGRHFGDFAYESASDKDAERELEKYIKRILTKDRYSAINKSKMVSAKPRTYETEEAAKARIKALKRMLVRGNLIVRVTEDGKAYQILSIPSEEF